ncbi:MAG: flippase-like domain-containing protein, partial [Flavobacteriales bacterium]|nr:flippase-like domain-containing protein [Flavobacteriales bacterium]
LAFTGVSDHFLIYGRQLVMWVIMLISPTPGGAGIAEFAFNGFLKEFIPIGLAGLLVVLWRLISYYPYLLIGSFVLPKWMKRVM